MIWYFVGGAAAAVLGLGFYICRKWWLWRPTLALGTIAVLTNWAHHELSTVLLIYALMLSVVATLHGAEMAHELNLRLNLPHPEDCACGGRSEMP